MRLLDSIVVLVLISGCTDPRPMPSALTARVHPAPDELQLDSRTNRLHVGERVSLWLEAASFEDSVVGSAALLAAPAAEAAAQPRSKTTPMASPGVRYVLTQAVSVEPYDNSNL